MGVNCCARLLWIDSATLSSVSPKGRRRIAPYSIARDIFHRRVSGIGALVLAQDFQILLLERAPAMMFRLALNVFPYGIEGGRSPYLLLGRLRCRNS